MLSTNRHFLKNEVAKTSDESHEKFFITVLTDGPNQNGFYELATLRHRRGGGGGGGTRQRFIIEGGSAQRSKPLIDLLTRNFSFPQPLIHLASPLGLVPDKNDFHYPFTHFN